jgi:predicted nucleic acid-binding protein
LIAHSRKELGWERVQELFATEDSEILAASLSLTEFARRLCELGVADEEARRTAEGYQDLLDEIVPIDESVALAAFDLGRQVPRRIPLADALIAAAARERDACLVHRDGHMAQIPAHLIEQINLAGGLVSESSREA